MTFTSSSHCCLVAQIYLLFDDVHIDVHTNNDVDDDGVDDVGVDDMNRWPW